MNYFDCFLALLFFQALGICSVSSLLLLGFIRFLVASALVIGFISLVFCLVALGLDLVALHFFRCHSSASCFLALVIGSVASICDERCLCC